MVFEDEFVGEIVDNLDARISEMDTRQRVEVWPGDDDFGNWLAFHERKSKAVICNAPEFKDTPFCGTGYH